MPIICHLQGFAAIWHLSFWLHGDLEPENLGAEVYNPCVYLLENKTCNILAAKRLRLMLFDNQLIIDSLKAACYSRVKKGKTSILWHKTMRIQYILTNLGIFGNLFQKDKVLCCSIISKGKTKAPAAQTCILWHKTEIIQDTLTNLELYLITN